MLKQDNTTGLLEQQQTELTQKEKLALLSGGLALLLVVALALYIPSGPRKNYIQAQNQLRSLQNELNNAKLLKAEQEIRLQSQEIIVDLLENRTASFDLFTYMSRVLEETRLNEEGRALLENLRNRRDLENQPAVDLTLTGVTLAEIIDLLHKVHTSNNVIAIYKVDRFQPERNGNGLDCKLTLVSLYPVEEGAG